jgi:uncharacterized membrane protein YwaF
MINMVICAFMRTGINIQSLVKPCVGLGGMTSNLAILIHKIQSKQYFGACIVRALVQAERIGH